MGVPLEFGSLKAKKEVITIIVSPLAGKYEHARLTQVLQPD